MQFTFLRHNNESCHWLEDNVVGGIIFQRVIDYNIEDNIVGEIIFWCVMPSREVSQRLLAAASTRLDG